VNNFDSVYKQVYDQINPGKTAELRDKANKEQQDLINEKNDKAQDINNNPWYSEGKRQMELKKLDTSYETTLSNFAKLYEAQYQQDMENVRYLTTGIVAEQQFQMEMAQKKQEAVDALKRDTRTTTVEANGREYLVTTDSQGNVTNKVDLGAAKTTGTDTGINNQITDNERALMAQFRGEQIVKDYNQILSQKGAIDNYIQNGVGGPADLALVFSFMKGLDPTSVVRESEYANAAKSGNLFQGVWAKFNGYFKEKGGILPANVRTEFQNLVNQKLASQQNLYDNVSQNYRDIAKRQGLNPANVVVDYAGAVTSNNTDSGDVDAWLDSF
jgi:hypothetical protein